MLLQLQLYTLKTCIRAAQCQNAPWAELRNSGRVQRILCRLCVRAAQAACAKQGVETPVSEISIEKRGDSGRAVTLLVNDHPVQAAELRLALGSTKMRSTLLTSLKTDADGILMAGKGYGHGVGMSQWGAYGMAQEGKSAEEIVMHYFREVTLARAW